MSTVLRVFDLQLISLVGKIKFMLIIRFTYKPELWTCKYKIQHKIHE